MSAALQAAEKVNSKRLLVARALSPVRVLLPLSSKHSQEWLCYSTFSATCLAAEALLLQFSHKLFSPAVTKPSGSGFTACGKKRNTVILSADFARRIPLSLLL
jgi:hypothetical protein